MQDISLSTRGQRPIDTASGDARRAVHQTARLPLGEPAAEGSPRDGLPRSLYVHIPFCFHKCHYCDFYSIVDRQDRQAAFTDRLIAELAALGPYAGELGTIFIGGGTPTLLEPGLWRRLLGALRELFAFADDLEFSVECNPETASAELFAILAAGGVNRLSLGAQTFDPRHLKTLERWHDPANVGRALRLAADAGIGRTSVDLIFAIPGQTVDDWRCDLETAIALGTTHISAYNLTYEPGTAMTARLDRGLVSPTDEQTEISMLDAAIDTLGAAGLGRYEVSNFAHPGHECRHNLAYWRQEQWLAAGPSASAHVGGHRWKNTPRLDTYLAVGGHAAGDAPGGDGFSPIVDHEPPDAARALAERLMTGLRLWEGLPGPDMLAACDAADPTGNARGRLARVIDDAAAAGDLDDPRGSAAERWRLSRQGMLMADGIAADAIAAVTLADD